MGEKGIEIDQQVQSRPSSQPTSRFSGNALRSFKEPFSNQVNLHTDVLGLEPEQRRPALMIKLEILSRS